MIEKIKITSLSGRGSVEMRRGDALGYWLGPVDWGQVPATHHTYSYPNQVGESIAATTLGGRALSVTGWVMDGGTGDLQSRCDFLNAFVSPVEDYILEYRGKKIQFRPDSSIAYSPEYTKNNEKVRRFLIQATCAFPLFSDLADSAAAFDDSGKLFRFPTGFGRQAPLVFGTQSHTYTVEVNNAGGFQTGIVARFSFSGQVDNPRIKNLTTEEWIRVNRRFTRGELLEVSTLPGAKRMTLYKTDGERENMIRYRDLENTWIQLLPGRNLLALDCEDLAQRPAMGVTVFFTPLYLEVE